MTLDDERLEPSARSPDNPSEAALQGILEHPARLAFGALVISVVVAVLSGVGFTDDLLLGIAELAAFAVWLYLWDRRHSSPAARLGALDIILALAGLVLLALLAARHVVFSIVALPLLMHYFISLPFAVAVVAVLPLVYAAESAHRRAVLADPRAYPWAATLVLVAAVILVGFALRAMARQREERAQLQASLASAERRAGALRERQRLAREIHDTLAQEFAGIIIHFERAEQADSLATSPAKPHLEQARAMAREGLEDARRMLGALRPEILEQRALPEALERVCQEWSRRSGIEASLSITGSAFPLHPDIEVAVLRGTQEALANAARHSEARTVAVTLSYMDDLVVLDVQDDGKGFLASAVEGKGYGLEGMRERIKRLRGSLSIESAPGEGTTVSLSLPAVVTSTSEIVTGGNA
jgi:signal transduction histidine kinase